jgi:hypothetical protein
VVNGSLVAKYRDVWNQWKLTRKKNPVCWYIPMELWRIWRGKNELVENCEKGYPKVLSCDL